MPPKKPAKKLSGKNNSDKSRQICVLRELEISETLLKVLCDLKVPGDVVYVLAGYLPVLGFFGFMELH